MALDEGLEILIFSSVISAIKNASNNDYVVQFCTQVYRSKPVMWVRRGNDSLGWD